MMQGLFFLMVPRAGMSVVTVEQLDVGWVLLDLIVCNGGDDLRMCNKSCR